MFVVREAGPQAHIKLGEEMIIDRQDPNLLPEESKAILRGIMHKSVVIEAQIGALECQIAWRYAAMRRLNDAFVAIRGY